MYKDLNKPCWFVKKINPNSESPSQVKPTYLDPDLDKFSFSNPVLFLGHNPKLGLGFLKNATPTDINFIV